MMSMNNSGVLRHIYMSDSAVTYEYYQWLCDLVGFEYQNRSYYLLLKALHNRNFTWTVPNDDNRAFEGKELRCKFCEEHGIIYDYDQYNMAASMLEVIIALAYRCENIMADQNENIPMRDWFWKLLVNVGLDNFPDVGFYDTWEGGSVDEILDRIIDRTYKRDGRGGLFPLKRPKKDQRKVELWYQMSNYLVENYYMEDFFV